MTDQSKDPYGVPTGVVPRVLHRECATFPPSDRCSECRPRDPVQQAVDDWLLMERKALAWDELVRFSKQANSTAEAIAGRLLDLATGQVQEPNHVR